MQNLYAAVLFRRYIIEKADVKNSKLLLTNAIGRVFELMNKGTKLSDQEENTKNHHLRFLLHYLEQIEESYSRGQQHDSMTFLFNILNEL